MTSRQARREADRKLRAQLTADPDAELLYRRSGQQIHFSVNGITPPELAEVLIGLWMRFDPQTRGAIFGTLAGIMQGAVSLGSVAEFIATGDPAAMQRGQAIAEVGD